MLYSLTEDELKRKIASRDVPIGFVGLGRVGLPLAATLAEAGFAVTGVDVKEAVVAKVNAGQSPYVDEAGLDELIRRVTASGRLQATTHIAATLPCQVIIIAVPTLTLW